MADFVKFKPEQEENKMQKQYKRRRINFKGIFIMLLFFFILTSIISSITYSLTPKISVIPIKGIVASESSNSIYGKTMSSREIAEQIKLSVEDTSVKAILIDINSPGGSPVATEEISRAIEKAKKEKPVYAVIGDVGASAAYWIGTSADKLYASKLSIVGSIGVTSAGLGFEDFIAEHNITYRQQTSGKYKDIGTPFKKPTEEEEKILQNILNEMHLEFKKQVSTSRNISLEDLEQYAQGQIFLGGQAKEINLIDDIGYYDSTIDELKNLTNSQNAIVVVYESQPTLSEIFGFNTIFQIPNMESQILLK